MGIVGGISLCLCWLIGIGGCRVRSDLEDFVMLRLVEVRLGIGVSLQITLNSGQSVLRITRRQDSEGGPIVSANREADRRLGTTLRKQHPQRPC